MSLEALEKAYQLWKSDARIETYGAVVIVLGVLGPVALELWRERNTDARR